MLELAAQPQIEENVRTEFKNRRFYKNVPIEVPYQIFSYLISGKLCTGAPEDSSMVPDSCLKIRIILGVYVDSDQFSQTYLDFLSSILYKYGKKNS